MLITPTTKVWGEETRSILAGLVRALTVAGKAALGWIAKARRVEIWCAWTAFESILAGGRTKPTRSAASVQLARERWSAEGSRVARTSSKFALTCGLAV